MARAGKTPAGMAAVTPPPPLPPLGRVGLGAMPLSTAGRPDREAATATVHAALDAGVRLVDTADAYCLDDRDTGHNESLVAAAVRTWDGPRHEVVVATKGGHVRTRTGGWATDGRPEHLRDAARRSRDRLGVEQIALYQFHRPDPATPFLRSVEALAELRADGVVGHVGLSNVSLAQLQAATGVVEVASVQNELSPYVDDDPALLEWCAAHGVAYLAYAPLGGAGRAGAVGDDAATRAFAQVARARGVSVARVVLAWLLARSPAVVPIPGARRPATILDSAAAATLGLSPDELARLDGPRR